MAINGSSFDSGLVCYSPCKITTNGIWQGDDPLQYSLPLFILQLTLVVVLTRILGFILKPFGQPRVISEILGGILLGPSVLGNVVKFGETVFPLRSIMVLETIANVGLLYFLFLIGVEMDISMIRKSGKKALSIASAGMLLPFLVGASASFILENKARDEKPVPFLLFLGVALSVTAFPVLARILAELKLLNTDLGRVAMSAAVITDMCAWSLLALAISISESDKNSSLSALWVILSSITYVMFCFFAVRPGIEWLIHGTPEGGNFSDFTVCLILTGVMISGFITDAIGTHSIFGAFVFGLVIPNGPLATTLVEKLEDFVSGLLLPLFFAISGLRTDVKSIVYGSNSVFLLLVIMLSAIAKMVGTFLVGVFFEMPSRDGLALGLLMSTKGLIEMIVLNVGRDQKVLDEEIFSVMVIVALVTTAVITPCVAFVYKPARRFMPYKRRTIQKLKPDGELRILACLHTPRNVPTIINLLEASHPTKRSPINVYALHLVELTGRASAMLIVHGSRKDERPAINRTQAQSEHIINAFEDYEQHADFVAVQPLTAMSPYSTMHEDICNLAEYKHAALIIVPFHKKQTIDGGMEATNPAFRRINQNVLANAPCSVGILVDRGLGASTRHSTSYNVHRIAVLFFGGPDDRESLAYGLRMSENPNVNITVVRFLPGEEAQQWSKHPVNDSKEPATLSVITDNERERQLDEEFLNEFRTRTVNNDSIIYMEKVTNNGEDTVSAIRGMDSSIDLYIVGRGQGIISPLTAGLTEWSECPELGAIGDLLASSDFSATVSVLVVQQYSGLGSLGSSAGTTPDCSNSPGVQTSSPHKDIGNHRQQPGVMPWQQDH